MSDNEFKYEKSIFTNIKRIFNVFYKFLIDNNIYDFTELEKKINSYNYQEAFDDFYTTYEEIQKKHQKTYDSTYARRTYNYIIKGFLNPIEFHKEDFHLIVKYLIDEKYNDNYGNKTQYYVFIKNVGRLGINNFELTKNEKFKSLFHKIYFVFQINDDTYLEYDDDGYVEKFNINMYDRNGYNKSSFSLHDNINKLKILHFTNDFIRDYFHYLINSYNGKNKDNIKMVYEHYINQLLKTRVVKTIITIKKKTYLCVFKSYSKDSEFLIDSESKYNTNKVLDYLTNGNTNRENKKIMVTDNVLLIDLEKSIKNFSGKNDGVEMDLGNLGIYINLPSILFMCSQTKYEYNSNLLVYDDYILSKSYDNLRDIMEKMYPL